MVRASQTMAEILISVLWLDWARLTTANNIRDQRYLSKLDSSVFRLNWFPFTAQSLTEMEIVIRQINITQASSEVSCNASY